MAEVSTEPGELEVESAAAPSRAETFWLSRALNEGVPPGRGKPFDGKKPAFIRASLARQAYAQGVSTEKLNCSSTLEDSTEAFLCDPFSTISSDSRQGPPDSDGLRKVIDAWKPYSDSILGQIKARIEELREAANPGLQADSDLPQLLNTVPGTATVSAGANFSAAVVDGLTSAIIERAEEEATLGAMLRLQRLVDDAVIRGDVNGKDGKKDTTTVELLPNVKRAIGEMDRVDLKALVPALREAFVKDLQDLPYAISNPTLPLYNDLSDKSGVILAQLLAEKAVRIRDGEGPLAAVAQLASWPEDLPDADCQNKLGSIVPYVRLVGALAQQLEMARLAPPDNFKIEEKIKDPKYVAYLIAFILHDWSKLKAIADEKESEDSLRLKMPHPGELVAGEAVALRRLVVLVNALDDAVVAAEDTSAAKNTAFFRFQRVGQVMIAALSQLPRSSEADGALEDAVEGVRRTMGIYRALEREDYNRVVVLALDWASLTLGEKSNISKPKLYRVLALGASVSSAETGAEVQEALLASLDPPGGFRQRRGRSEVSDQSGNTRNRNFALISYLGVAAGPEYARPGGGLSAKSGWHAGLTAPVGLEFSWGYDISVLKSIGFMGSFLDLGTLVNYRLTSDEIENTGDTEAGESTGKVKQNPQITLDQVFAPGAFLTFGFTENLPITIGGGVQYAPRLRSVDGVLTTDEASALRGVLFFGFDLTLFTF